VFLLQNGMYACKTCTPPYEIKADGSDQAVSGHPYIDTVAIHVVNDHAIEETDKKGGKVVATSTSTVSPDGNTVMFSFSDSSNTNGGPPVTGKGEATRVEKGPAGSNAISGSWRTTKMEGLSDNAIVWSYKVSGDEIISDTWELKEIDDAVYEINCKKVTKGMDNIDIGANPSAEEAEEALEEGQTTVIDIVDAFRLNYLGDEASGTRLFATKKDYLGQLKTYMKKVVEKLKEEGADEAAVKKFQTGAQGYFTKTIAPNFKDYDFYVGESMDTDGMVVLLNYREDGITPYITIWKYGLSEEKV